MIPVGDRVTLQKGEQAHITQTLGGSYTVIVNGNMFRIEGKDADALGLGGGGQARSAPSGPVTQEQLEKEVWNQLAILLRPGNPRQRRGPRPDLRLPPHAAAGGGHYKVDVKMTLTAPGCGMGPVLAQDVQNKLLCLERVDEVAVELVWDPPWNQGMMTEAAKLQLGLL